MHIVRFADPHGQVHIGVRDETALRTVPGATRAADLLRLPVAELRELVDSAAAGQPVQEEVCLLPPVDGHTEVWASGVTYARSQQARMEESTEQSVYDRVYTAERPELFFKALAWRVVTDGEAIGVRSDSAWNVPEPELAVFANSHGEIVGYGVCNDVSSRTIEGENPLYLPQAKVYAGSCALATGIRPAWEVADHRTLDITLEIHRDGATCFEGTVNTTSLHRELDVLIEHLYRGQPFPHGAVLATGTGVVPESGFTLHDQDLVRISVAEVGTLTNQVTSDRSALNWLGETIDQPHSRRRTQ